MQCTKGRALRVKTIHIVAERGAGSTYFKSIIRRATGVKVIESFCMHKHLFQTRFHERALASSKPSQDNSWYQLACLPL